MPQAMTIPDERWTCPVCHYPNLDADPDAMGYDICPGCGTEFGLDDWSVSHEELREAWVSAGSKWWADRAPELKPEKWPPE